MFNQKPNHVFELLSALNKSMSITLYCRLTAKNLLGLKFEGVGKTNTSIAQRYTQGRRYIYLYIAIYQYFKIPRLAQTKSALRKR